MKKIELIRITKKYNKKIILNETNYVFEEGKIYQLVGENGCGKSTLLKIILGFINYNGIVVNSFENYSYVPDKINFPNFIKVNNFIKIISSAKGVEKKSLY